MSTQFWILRFFSILSGAFFVIFIAQYFKSDNAHYALTQAIIWGPATAIVYTIILFFKLKRNPSCAIKQDK